MKKTIQRGLIAAFTIGVALLLTGAGPAWNETYQNLLVRGTLFVGSGTPPSGGGFGAATVTVNNTATFSGPVKVSGATARGAFTATAGQTTQAITGDFGDDSYDVDFPETVNVSVSGATAKTATGFTANYVATSNTSQSYRITHY